MIIRSKILKLSSLCIIGATVLLTRGNDSSLDANNGIGHKVKNCIEETKKDIFDSEDTDDNKDNSIQDASSSIDSNKQNDTMASDNANAGNEGNSKQEQSNNKAQKVNSVIPDIKGLRGGTINPDDYKNVVIAKSNGYLNVRSGAGTNYDVIAKMSKNSAGYILETKKNGNETWYKIKSGDVEGYVSSEYLYTGMEALNKVVEVGRYVIKVNCNTLNVREKPSTSSQVICQVSKGEQLEVVGVENDWVEVSVAVGKDTAYVAKEHVDISFELKTAVKIDDLMIGVSTVRTKLVQYAKQFLGNPYVYGGTSLTNGIDCSAFTQAIFKKFGYDLPRTAAAQAESQGGIKMEQLNPGDLVFYASGGRVSHVAIYIGKVDGKHKIIHASNPRDDITIDNMLYTTPYKYIDKIGK